MVSQHTTILTIFTANPNHTLISTNQVFACKAQSEELKLDVCGDGEGVQRLGEGARHPWNHSCAPSLSLLPCRVSVTSEGKEAHCAAVRCDNGAYRLGSLTAEKHNVTCPAMLRDKSHHMASCNVRYKSHHFSWNDLCLLWDLVLGWKDLLISCSVILHAERRRVNGTCFSMH